MTYQRAASNTGHAFNGVDYARTSSGFSLHTSPPSSFHIPQYGNPDQANQQPDNNEQIKLHVCNISAHVNQAQLRSLFEPYGHIIEVFILKRPHAANKQCRSAFVRMSPVSAGMAAKKATDGMKFGGLTLRVQTSKLDTSSNDSQRQSQSSSSRSVHGSFSSECSTAPTTPYSSSPNSFDLSSVSVVSSEDDEERVGRHTHQSVGWQRDCRIVCDSHTVANSSVSPTSPASECFVHRPYEWAHWCATN